MVSHSSQLSVSKRSVEPRFARNFSTAADFVGMSSSLLAYVIVQIPARYFTLGTEPHILEPLGVTDALLEYADDIGSAADVGVHERIDELGRAGLPLCIQQIKSALEAFKIDPRGILGAKDERKIVGAIEPRHDHQWFAIDHPMLGNVRSR